MELTASELKTAFAKMSRVDLQDEITHLEHMKADTLSRVAGADVSELDCCINLRKEALK